MNRLCVALLMGTFLIFATKITLAQIVQTPATTIAPYEMAISYNKTTNLIFPYAIRSVDRGSNTVIVQKAKAVDNIMQVKAAQKDFEPTNLSIVTADGRFYSFLLKYAEHPSHLNVSFAGDEPAKLVGQLTNADQLELESLITLSMPAFMRFQRVDRNLHLRLSGIFHSENTLWLKLHLYNSASVDFQPAFVRFFLRDRRRAKRTALQELEVIPIYKSVSKTTKGKTSSVWTVGFKPLTVPKRQQLIIQVGDETRGRVLHLPVKSRFFLSGRKLPS